MKAYPPPPSARRNFPHALVEATNAHISVLDPTGARTELFARNNKDAPKPGDILLVTFKTSDPFSGVCLNIRRRGTDTALLLRNQLLMTGVEMWVKIYSPAVRSIEVVQRAEKRARRARLYYMRWVLLSPYLLKIRREKAGTMFGFSTKHSAQETETRSRQRREGGGGVPASETVAPWRRVETGAGGCQGAGKAGSREKKREEGWWEMRIVYMREERKRCFPCIVTT